MDFSGVARNLALRESKELARTALPLGKKLARGRGIFKNGNKSTFKINIKIDILGVEGKPSDIQAKFSKRRWNFIVLVVRDAATDFSENSHKKH